MKTKIMIAVGVTVVVVVAAGMLFLNPSSTEQLKPVTASAPLQDDVASVAIKKPVLAPQSLSAPAVPELVEDLETDEEQSQRLIEEYGFKPENIESLRATREGDPRAPEIGRYIPRELPTPEEVADPELYAKFELKQRGKFITGYVASSKVKIEELQNFLDENREGIKPDDILDIEEEIAELKKVRDRMINEYPELLEESGVLEESEAGEGFSSN